MPVSALAASRLLSPSVSGVGAARPTYYKNLSDAGIAALSAAQIGAMQPVEMAALRTSQIGAFNPQALASGLLTYQNNTGEALPATVISGLSGSQIGQFSKPLLQSVLPSLSNTQLGAITGPQIGVLPSASLAALKPAQLVALNPSALASGLESYVSNKQVIPVKIIASLGSASISQFSGSLVNAALSKMSATQIGAINPASISGIGTAALQSLSGAQLSGFTQTQVTQASTAQIASLKPQQISALPTTWLNVLSSEQLQSLSNASIAALTTAQIVALDTDHVQYLSGAQVASLSKAQLGALNSNQIQAIDAPDISAMSTGQFSALSKMQLQALRVEQIAEVNVAKARTISAKNIASMSYQQIAAFTTPTVTKLNGTQLAALTAQQISQGLNAEKIAAFSPTQLRFFTGAQFQAMTNAEVAAISLDAIKKLSDKQLTAFTAGQLSRFSKVEATWVFNQKSRAGFSTEQWGAIEAVKNRPEVGDATIDLGEYGKLIMPVQIDGGKWYYYWDRSGDGTSSNAGGLNGGSDLVSRDEVSNVFYKDANGNDNPEGYKTTQSYRYATINEVNLALPTLAGGQIAWVHVAPAGTTVGSSPASLGSNEVNPTYDDMAAIWDAYNGTATHNWGSGVPPGWPSDTGPWATATPIGPGTYFGGRYALWWLSNGSAINTTESATSVAVQVLSVGAP